MKALMHVKLKRGSFALRKSPHSNVKEDLATLVFDTVTCDIIQYIESLKVSAALGDLRLYDGSTKGTLYRKMIGVKDRKEKTRYTKDLPARSYSIRIEQTLSLQGNE